MSAARVPGATLTVSLSCSVEVALERGKFGTWRATIPHLHVEAIDWTKRDALERARRKAVEVMTKRAQAVRP